MSSAVVRLDQGLMTSSATPIGEGLSFFRLAMAFSGDSALGALRPGERLGKHHGHLHVDEMGRDLRAITPRRARRLFPPWIQIRHLNLGVIPGAASAVRQKETEVARASNFLP